MKSLSGRGRRWELSEGGQPIRKRPLGANDASETSVRI